MANYIKLFDGSKLLSEHNLPSQIAMDDSNYFVLGKVRKAGGNGVVLEASHYQNHSLKRRCAVKFLRRLDAPRRDRFTNEIRIVTDLSHDNIAAYYGKGILRLGAYDVPWVAQELGGRNMREEVETYGAISPALLKAISLQMCSAFEHLHSKKFIHRDIKPDNFVWAENSKSDVLMIDLGIAKRIDEDVSGRPMDMLTRTMESIGPMFFYSPELIAYGKDKRVTVDERSDIFQLGKTIWFLATGQVSAGVPSKALCPMGGKLRDIVLNIVDDDPACRPQSMAELRQRINSL